MVRGSGWDVFNFEFSAFVINLHHAAVVGLLVLNPRRYYFCLATINKKAAHCVAMNSDLSKIFSIRCSVSHHHISKNRAGKRRILYLQ